MRLTRPERAGFTLMELVLVVMVIAIVMAVALPSLVPMLAWSQLEGAARHLANFGRSSVAHCALTQERITVRFDLDSERQEYWCVRWVEKDDGMFDDDEEEEAEQDLLDQTSESAMELLSQNRVDEVDEMAAEMQERFERFFRMGLEARTRNVKHDGILAEVGPLIEEDFSLDDEEEEFEEVKTSLLSRVSLPRDVVIESIRLGGQDHTTGIVELEVTPMGMVEPAMFYVRGGESDYFTVIWDPITGSARIQRGKDTGE
ncbi:MAG: prepilin-type N-terminal cleavage/methylation domain-containing protein [bacterium]|nr:prepilin-type N-terminal cleavage/methylation domain-containing protein [bacterium]